MTTVNKLAWQRASWRAPERRLAGEDVEHFGGADAGGRVWRTAETSYDRSARAPRCAEDLEFIFGAAVATAEALAMFGLMALTVVRLGAPELATSYMRGLCGAAAYLVSARSAGLYDRTSLPFGWRRLRSATLCAFAVAAVVIWTTTKAPSSFSLPFILRAASAAGIVAIIRTSAAVVIGRLSVQGSLDRYIAVLAAGKRPA